MTEILNSFCLIYRADAVFLYTQTGESPSIPTGTWTDKAHH